MLQSVQRGDDDSPALRTLVATGLVAQREDGGYDITAAGLVALAAGPSRRERIAWAVLTVCVAVLLADTVVGWFT